MNPQILRFTLFVMIIYVTGGGLNSAVAAPEPAGGNGTHFCGVIDGQWGKQDSDQFPNRRYARASAETLNVGDPRTVRMIYFLPNDRPYRTEVVQLMRDEMVNIQTFFAEQMQAHGYGKLTFRIETDPQGEPIVHRVDGQHPDNHYFNKIDLISDEIEQRFDLNANIYLVVIDNSGELVIEGATGIGYPIGRSGGFVLVNEEFSRDLPANLATHELGHGFGLGHDFRDGDYIMSYGPGWSRLSACHAEFLSVHPYFNPDIPIEEGQPSTIELISPRTYPAGAKSGSVQLKVSDSEGLHQVLLGNYNTTGVYGYGLTACRELAGKKDALVEFKYDSFITENGVTFFSHVDAHRIRVEAVDTGGNLSYEIFTLVSFSPGYIVVATLEGHAHWVNSVSFSPEGTTLAAGSWQEVKLWDVATHQNIVTLEKHMDSVNSVSFSPDETTLASGSWDRTVKLWDVATHQNIATLEEHTDQVTSVSFSPDRVTLASGSYDGTVKLWDVATRTSIATFEEDRDWPWIYSVSFSSDGTILASGAADGTVKLWDMATRQNIVTLEKHTDGVNSVSFSPDGATLASGSWDRLVKLWDVTTGVSFTTLPHTDGVLSVSFSPDGATLASGTVDGKVELWDTSMLMEARLEAVAEIIDIPDSNLRAAITNTLGKSPSAPIVRRHMTTLTGLEASGASVRDLTGLDTATNLTYLGLSENNISDISAVSGLNNLRDLNLGDNSITDISAVSDLNNLRDLSLWNNSITDISAVAGLTNLTELSFSDNSVSDISAVAGLINLTFLGFAVNSVSDISAVSGLINLTKLRLQGNSVSDISALAGLINLTELGLGDNSVSDISAVSNLTDLTYLDLVDNLVSDLSPLVANTGLGNRDGVGVWGNPLSYQSIHIHIPILQERGVEITFDNQAHPAFLKISGNNQKGASFVALSQPLVVEAQDENGSALAGVSVTFAVTAGGGALSTTITRTDENGRAQSTLTLGPNLGTNTVQVSAVGIESTATFYAIAETESPPIIVDVNNDGVVNVLDLVVITSELGSEGQNLTADVNGDRVVSILDLVLAAGMFDDAAAAPSAQPQVPETLTAVEVQRWLTDARSLDVRNSIMERGFVMLEQLLVSLTPKETELLANYPNPFNPETWIPYRLAEDAFVTLTIYDQSGRVVRTLEVGHRIASAYENRSKAIYWDGRNDIGEGVASGVYFYTLTAGDYSATRKMVILK